MKADGCPWNQADGKKCEWPKDKFLDVQPILARHGKVKHRGVQYTQYSIWADCEWNNYNNPMIRRTYLVCPVHYTEAREWIEESIALDKAIDQYNGGIPHGPARDHADCGGGCDDPAHIDASREADLKGITINLSPGPPPGTSVAYSKVRFGRLSN